MRPYLLVGGLLLAWLGFGPAAAADPPVAEVVHGTRHIATFRAPLLGY